MIIEVINIDCKAKELPKFPWSFKNQQFRVIEYTFSYMGNREDREFIDEVIADGKILAKLVNPWSANNGLFARDSWTLDLHWIGWVLAEKLWKMYLDSEGISTTVLPMTEAKDQIDLIVAMNSKKIEVRSSFPKNWINFAICSKQHEFDIIWPYTASYKPWEIMKDYYVRTLYPYDVNNFMNELKQDWFKAYLCWGATWKMMEDNQIAEDKNFKPDGFKITKASNYRVIPYRNALDTIIITETIRNNI